MIACVCRFPCHRLLRPRRSRARTTACDGSAERLAAELDDVFRSWPATARPGCCQGQPSTAAARPRAGRRRGVASDGRAAAPGRGRARAAGAAGGPALDGRPEVLPVARATGTAELVRMTSWLDGELLVAGGQQPPACGGTSVPPWRGSASRCAGSATRARGGRTAGTCSTWAGCGRLLADLPAGGVLPEVARGGCGDGRGAAGPVGRAGGLE